MISAFGVDHGEDYVSKGLIPPIKTMTEPIKAAGKAFGRGTKAGFGGWSEGGGLASRTGMRVGRAGEYALRNKKAIGIGAGIGAGGIGTAALAT